MAGESGRLKMPQLPSRVLFAAGNAYETIMDETERSPELETGGILVGRPALYNSQMLLVVLAASRPGTGAKRSPVSFMPDMESDLQALGVWRERYSRYGLDYVGQWHKHPHGVPGLTAGDVFQARAILRDPDYVLSHGGILVPITQLGDAGGELHVYYVTRDRPKPVQCQFDVLAEDELLSLLEECAGQVPPLVATASPDGAALPSPRMTTSRPQAKASVDPENGSDRARQRRADTRNERIIIGQYTVLQDGQEPESRGSAAQAPPEPVVDSMAAQALIRELARLEHLGRRQGFTVTRPDTDTLDYIELVFQKPIPLPESAVVGLPTSDDPEKGRRGVPSGAEPIRAIRVLYPHEYPASEPKIWILGEHDYPVSLRVLRERSANTLERQIEALIHWLTSSHPKDLPDLIQANAELLYRQGLRMARKGVSRLDLKLADLEERSQGISVAVDTSDSEG